MSENALEACKQARLKQINLYQARHIRSKVDSARGAPGDSGVRWPFELIQNATDTPPREDKHGIEVRLSLDGNKFAFEHDGAAFSPEELTALLHGGSSKEYDSQEKTGRFGTGFLVTHVLSERTTVRGLLWAGTGYEEFDLTLDRSGDEERILGNIDRCDEAIRAASPVASLAGKVSARFEYTIQDTDSLRTGMETLKRTLPYLYATCPALGRVTLSQGSQILEAWVPEKVSGSEQDGIWLRDRTIRVERSDEAGRTEYRSLRFAAGERGGAALVVLRHDGSGWRVCVPESDFPRIFRRFPIRGSAFLPINFLLDGLFDPDDERRTILLNERGRKLLREGLRAAGIALRFIIDKRFRDGHLLARCYPPKSYFSNHPDENAFWLQELKQFAGGLATMPLVQTRLRRGICLA